MELACTDRLSEAKTQLSRRTLIERTQRIPQSGGSRHVSDQLTVSKKYYMFASTPLVMLQASYHTPFAEFNTQSRSGGTSLAERSNDSTRPRRRVHDDTSMADQRGRTSCSPFILYTFLRYSEGDSPVTFLKTRLK